MKRFAFYLACLMFSTCMMAQDAKVSQGNREQHRIHNNQGNRREFSPEKFQKHLQDFIVKETNLTTDEQTKFFPLLKEMMDAQRNLMDQERQLMKQGKDAKTESDYEKIITKSTELQVENRKTEQTYYKKFSKVLSWEKIFKVRRAINKFQMQAIKSFAPRQQKAGGRQNAGPKPQPRGRRR